MDNSKGVTIEGENYEVVDQCIEEENTSNSMQSKCMKSADAEKQSTSIEEQPVDVLTDNTMLHKHIEQDGSINVEKNEDMINKKNEDVNNEKNKGVNNKKNEDINKKKNGDMDNEMNENIYKKQNEGVNKKKNEDINDEKNEDENNKKDENIVEGKNKNMISIEPTEHQKPQKEDINSVNSSLLNNSNSNNDIQNNTEEKSSQQSNTESLDFTADINLDQLDNSQQKDVTDEDVLNQLDEIENIVLDAQTFQIQEESQSKETDMKDESYNLENDKVTEETEPSNNTEEKITYNIDKDNQGVNAETSEESSWYEKKIAEKEAIIKERLTKVARVLGISYPCYEKWLENEEKINGSPLCKLKPSRRCCLDKPYTNRWKFICARKKIQKSTTDTGDIDTCYTKNTKTVWKVEPSGQWGVNTDNESQFPPFVLRAVKIFEDFLQITELASQEFKTENFSDDISIDMDIKKDTNNETRQDWLWLVVRCNSMDELMLFATGKNISRSTMDKLKQVYESGPGKDCNVKSLYCKSTNKRDDTTVTDTTFLVGSEALDEFVGGLKVQLAPKTNFWSNAAGAENVAKTVMDILAPTPKATVLEIGCGIGLIGLMMASKCQQIIGVDSPSEVEEAEMTCELNNIKNASFIMGSPSEVTPKIINAAKNRKTFAIINANTNIGRAIEVMTCLRKIPSLKRIAMITTLTKQSVRAILELARPGDQSHGAPFVPILACVVDTLPTGANFEAVILLQRKMIHKFNAWQKNIQANVKKVQPNQIKSIEEKANETDRKTPGKGIELQIKKNINKPPAKAPPKKFKSSSNKPPFAKNDISSMKNKFKGKRPHSPDKSDALPKKLMKKLNRFGPKPWSNAVDTTTKIKKEWNTENPELHINPLYEKKMRVHKEQTDLRERLSNNRLDLDIAQTVKEHQALLEIAKEKLSGPAPTVDINTAKQLQSMLNMVLEQTNKLQSQLPRSVWDRIALPDNMNPNQREIKQEGPSFKGRYIQNMGTQDILITTPNKKFLNNEEQETKPTQKKYHNLMPLEPNTIMPVGHPLGHKEVKSFRLTPERFRESDMRQQQMPENPWNRDKNLERNRWNEMGNMKRSISPTRRQTSPKRPLLSPPRRPCSPPRKHFSPLRRPVSPVYRQRSPIRRQISPSGRPLSPRRMSPRRIDMVINRPMSPMRRQVSPLQRPMSPMGCTTSSSRVEMLGMKRPMSPIRRQIPSPNRMMSSNRQEMLASRRQAMPQERQQTSTMRRTGSPPRFITSFERPASPPRRQQSPSQMQQMSPQRFADDWDIPSRGAVEQTWNRGSNDRVLEQNVWQTDNKPTSSNNWDQVTCDDNRRHKTLNQEKWDRGKNAIRNDNWNSGANNWDTTKSSCTKPMMKETWSNSNDRWLAASNMPGNSKTDNWSIHTKDIQGSKEPWMDNKKRSRWESVNVKDSWKQMDKEDLNDLPEDARDPWGDDGSSDLKERWLKYESTSVSSTWMREKEQGDSWKHNKESWQNKGSFGMKPQWQNNSVQNVGEPRWLPQSDLEKKPTSSSNWQNGNAGGSRQFQSSNFQSQRPFPTTQFKGLY